ncbi:MAG TPA: response regulator [Gaiellales bacterium]|nr:response regulator [Gaiellales bacterium]
MPRTHHKGGSSELRILIVDEHDVYRDACAALLRTEGVVVAEVVPAGDVVGLAEALEPHVVLIDAATPLARLRETARRLRSLPSAPTVVLISSAGPDRLDGCLAELPFLAKADVCAQEVLRAHLRGVDEPAADVESW